MKDLKDVLSEAPALRDLAFEELIALGAALEDERFEEGEELFRRGDEASQLLFIADGSIRVERDGAALGKLSAGDVIGAVALNTIGERECDAIAEGPARVLSLSRESYLRLRGDFPTVALALQEGLIREMAGNIRAAVAQGTVDA